MYAAGIMSGTSLDGIDVVLCEITDSGIHTKIKQIGFETFAMREDLKEKIRTCCANHHVGSDLICSLNFELGEEFAKCVISLSKRFHMKTMDLSFIASHGQTIFHIPKAYGDFCASTLQIGESSVIAQRCGCPVISNFRVMDMANGGEGAPLVPFSEYILYRQKDTSVALQNIGGIGNVTILPKNCEMDDVFAFDTGPGNMMIDEAMQVLFQLPFDDDGKIAAKGCIIEELRQQLMQHPYLKESPPKSTGREMFGEDYTKMIIKAYKSEKAKDIIATLTWFTAYAIAENYRQFILPKHDVKEVILGGGGAHNKTMQRMLQEELPTVHVLTQEDKGFSSDAKEAIAFVILGNETWHQSASNVPSATGARQRCILGNITLAPYVDGRKENT